MGRFLSHTMWLFLLLSTPQLCPHWERGCQSHSLLLWGKRCLRLEKGGGDEAFSSSTLLFSPPTPPASWAPCVLRGESQSYWKKGCRNPISSGLWSCTDIS